MEQTRDAKMAATSLCLVACLVSMAPLTSGHLSPASIDSVLNPQNDDTVSLRRQCRGYEGLTDSQRSWCRSHAPLMAPLAQGAALGLRECRHQFSFERWECPINDSNPNYEYIMSTGSREGAFVSSIQSAGMTLAIARTCSAGNISRFCSCDTSVHDDSVQHNIRGKFDWGGCGDNFAKGYQFTSEFLDSPHKRLINRTKLDAMELQNNEAGRMAVRSTLQIICKCHGLTGSCGVKICWRSLPKVQVVGFILKEKYRNAVHVTTTQPSLQQRIPPSIVPIDLHTGNPTSSDLVFVRPSPDFCTPNHAVGINGTFERECKADSHGDDGCGLLCCGNGNFVKRSVLRQNCRCKFYFCCEVKCDSCLVAWETHHCNPPIPTASKR